MVIELLPAQQVLLPPEDQALIEGGGAVPGSTENWTVSISSTDWADKKAVPLYIPSPARMDTSLARSTALMVSPPG